VRANGGHVLFDGCHYLDLPAPARVVGVLLDPSAMHPGRSVGETVATTAMLAGVSTQRATECVEQVGLAEVRRRRVGALSLGMRQRLGLALALLGRPDTLVLDEPGNGLDPEGMKWLHELLVQHAATGGAVLLSSHHLAEVDRMADDIVVLDRGSLVPELSGPHGSSRSNWLTRAAVTSSDDPRLRQALTTAGVSATADANGLLADADPAVVGEIARGADIAVRSLVAVGDDLETAFLAVTRGEHRGRDASSAAGESAS
jgi:ABC-2 type transport system ATP-binding protein